MEHRYHIRIWMPAAFLAASCNIAANAAQHRRHSSRAWASNVIVPQVSAFAMGREHGVKITQVRAGAVIVEQVAATTLEISLANASSTRQQAELLIPVPDGAVVRGFDFQGTGAEPTAELLPKEEAAGTYRGLVAKIRDPALLEFAGYSLLRSSVFPVEARGTQKVRLTYENLLPADGARIDYLLPRSESLKYEVPWKISIRIKSRMPIQTVYSPTHEIQTVSRSENIVSARVVEDVGMEPGPFRISYLLKSNDVTASFLAYPDPGIGGGYFLMLAGIPDGTDNENRLEAIREITLVIDRSGSMRGEKMDQAKKAATDILDQLKPGEKFNLIAYNEMIDSFAPRPLVLSPQSRARAKSWIHHLNPNGGTNIYDALNEALLPEPSTGLLPLVLFLTDGLPTVGRTSESEIHTMIDAFCGSRRRIFTFGVGTDVNTP